jgi:hypothetical protein
VSREIDHRVRQRRSTQHCGRLEPAGAAFAPRCTTRCSRWEAAIPVGRCSHPDPTVEERLIVRNAAVEISVVPARNESPRTATVWQRARSSISLFAYCEAHDRTRLHEHAWNPRESRELAKSRRSPECLTPPDIKVLMRARRMWPAQAARAVNVAATFRMGQVLCACSPDPPIVGPTSADRSALRDCATCSMCT